MINKLYNTEGDSEAAIIAKGLAWLGIGLGSRIGSGIAMAGFFIGIGIWLASW